MARDDSTLGIPARRLGEALSYPLQFRRHFSQLVAQAFDLGVLVRHRVENRLGEVAEDCGRPVVAMASLGKAGAADASLFSASICVATRRIAAASRRCSCARGSARYVSSAVIASGSDACGFDGSRRESARQYVASRP